jgi:hypothetical protein
MVVVEPVPAIEPGLITHVPVEGRPLRSTLPVADAHVKGCVIVPVIGAGGASGAGSITTFPEASDVHPASLETVKLYVPGIRFVTVVLVPVPAIDPGLIVHVPVSGRPLNATLPVGVAHEEGSVIVPNIGMSGIPGAGRMITSAEGGDSQPDATETVKL